MANSIIETFNATAKFSQEYFTIQGIANNPSFQNFSQDATNAMLYGMQEAAKGARFYSLQGIQDARNKNNPVTESEKKMERIRVEKEQHDQAIEEEDKARLKNLTQYHIDKELQNLKSITDTLSYQSSDQQLAIAEGIKKRVNKLQDIKNSNDYEKLKSVEGIINTAIVSGEKLPPNLQKPTAPGVQKFADNSSIAYDGKGNYQYTDATGKVHPWSKEGTSVGAPIPQPGQQTGTQQTGTQQTGTQPPVNTYKTGSGNIKDNTPIPEVLKGGTILPYQYFAQHSINMGDRAKLATEMGLIKDPSEWFGTAGQNYALVDALEKQKQGATTEQPTTQPTEQAGKPGDWIADKARPIYHVEGELKKETPFDITVPERFTDTDTRKMLEKLSPEERNKKIGELDLLNVKAWLENAINNADISTINQLLGTTYHQGNERERMDELPMILANARMKLNTLTAEDATSYMNRTNSQMYGAQKTFSGDTSPRFVPGRQRMLLEIARDPSLLGTKWHTTIEPEEQKFIDQVKSSDQKNVYKENFNQFRNQYDTLLKSGDVEGAKNLWKQYKGTVDSMKQISPEYAAYAPELQKQVEEQVKVVKGPVIKPKKEIAPKKNIQTKPHPQPEPLGFTEKDLNEQQVQNLKDMKVQGKSLDEMRSKAIQYNESNKKSQIRPASFSETNNGTAPTLPNRIETSNISPDNPQALGLEKNPIRRN